MTGARTYFECRGPRDWRPVRLTVRYGPLAGVTPPPFPDALTGRLAPRNVAVRRDDGSTVVKPVRTLRRVRPGAAR